MDDQAFELLNSRLERIERKLDELQQSHMAFKYKVYGIVTATSVITSGFIGTLFKVFY